MNDEPKTTPESVSSAAVDALLRRKEAAGMTNAQIAERSGIPESTVAKLFSKTTPNPTFETVSRIARALDFSLDTLTAVSPERSEKPSEGSDHGTEAHPMPAMNERQENIFLKKLIESYDKQLKVKDRWITILAIALAVIFLSVLFIMIWDITHPNMGYVRYTVSFDEQMARLLYQFTI